LLASTDLTGALISLNAGHANHDAARTIVAVGGEYLSQLKANAPAGQAPLFSPTTATTTTPNTAS
jgi:hypothetical protein